MRTLVSIVVAMFFFSAVPAPAHAQNSHSASQAALDAAVQSHVTTTSTDRETVERLLARPEVQAVAGKVGLDLRGAQSAVSTLDAQALSTIAAQASQVDQALAGGQSVTISTTMIIIGLLVLILLIVAVG